MAKIIFRVDPPHVLTVLQIISFLFAVSTPAGSAERVAEQLGKVNFPKQSLVSTLSPRADRVCTTDCCDYYYWYCPSTDPPPTEPGTCPPPEPCPTPEPWTCPTQQPCPDPGTCPPPEPCPTPEPWTCPPPEPSSTPEPCPEPTSASTTTTTPPPPRDNPAFSKAIYQSSLPSWPIAGTTVHLGLNASTSDNAPIRYELLTSFEFFTLSATNDIIFISNVSDGAYVGPNNVMVVEVVASVIGNESRRDSAVIVIVFPRSVTTEEAS